MKNSIYKFRWHRKYFRTIVRGRKFIVNWFRSQADLKTEGPSEHFSIIERKYFVLAILYLNWNAVTGILLAS